jgi:hypothetical protein
MARRNSAYLLLFFALILMAHPAASRGPEKAIEYDASQLLTHRSGEFVSLEMEGLRPLADVGQPALPADVLQFVIPADARVEDVVISFLDEQELPGVYRVAPAQPEVPVGEVSEWADPDPAIYEADALFPASRVEYLGDGYLGGYRIASVAVYPLQYAPATGRLILATDVSLELSLAPGADRSRPRHRMTASSDHAYRSLVESIVENPDDVGGSRASAADVVEEVGPLGFDPRYTPSLDGSPVEYVIITTEELEPYFSDLVDWKIKKGVTTVVRTLSWIEANYPGGCDTPERIRMFIEDAYTSWGTTYVLLGGDTTIVPPRYIWSDYYGGWLVTCDAYFGDLDNDWNDDGDHVFGEGYGGASDPGDSVDLYVDVFVGRAPAGSSLEVETFVDKILTYEQAPNALFAVRNLFLAEVLFPYDWEPGDLISTDGAEHIVEPVLAYVPSHIRNSRLYQNFDPYPDAYPLTRQSAIDSLNVGYNITSHVGHGNKDIMRTSKNQYLVINDVDNLVNGVDKCGYMWMLNCTSTAIEFDCISEHFMNNPNGGSSMLFGPSRFCFPTTAKDYYHSWFEIFYTLGTTRAGAINAACKAPYVEESTYDNTDRWTQTSYVFLGDPETHLLTDRPTALSALHDASVPLGPASLVVTVTDPAAVDSAYVCLIKEGEVYATGYTDAAGQVTLNFRPQTTGQMTLTVTAQNHYPYEDTVGVVSSPTPHVTIRDVGIDDDGTPPSDGNANGEPEAGETVELNVTVGNGGQSNATAVTATLSTTDTYIAIVDSTEYLGDLAPGQHVFNGAFAIDIADDCPNEHYATIEITFDEAARDSWTDDHTFRVYRPVFVQNLNDVYDGPTGNGEPDPGETVTLTIDVLNEGNGDADLVAGTLRYPSGEVTISDSTDTWGDIAAGVTATGQTGFQFTVNSSITELFELELTDQDGKIWPLYFEMTRPAIPETLSGAVRGTTISLSWFPVLDTDLWGYNIYRTDHPAGTYQRTNDAVIEVASYYEDTGLDEEQKYYYRVAAVDLSGNESEWSEVLEISTNPPSMSGWPQVLTHGGAEPMYGTPAACDIDLDGDLEVFVASGPVCCWHHDGIEYIDGDGDPRTNGPYAADLVAGSRTSIAFGELDGDIYPELVAADWGNAGTPEDPAYNVWAWNAEDATPLPGWPVTTTKRCWASANLADLDRDGLDEVVLVCSDQRVYCWNGDGSELIDGDNNPSTVGVFARIHYSAAYASAAVADIDGDRELEVICGSRSDSLYCWNPDGSAVPGWPVNLGADIRTTIAVGDADNDGSPDILATGLDDRLYLLTATGDTFPNWPKIIEYGSGVAADYPPSPVFADFDGDGDLEIVAPGTDGTLTVFTWEGTELPGWPITFDSRNNSSPSVGDIDGDPGLEILIGSYSEKKVWAFDDDGALVDGWPIQTGADIWSTPTLADLDLDGDLEVLLSGMDVTLYIWDTRGDHADGAGVEWPTFMHDFRRWSYYGYEEPVGVPEEGEPIVNRLSLEQNTPNPFNPVTTIAFTVPADATEIDLSVYNVAGERVATLVSGAATPGRQSVVWNARDDAGERVASGIYFMRLTSDADTRTRKIVLLK